MVSRKTQSRWILHEATRRSLCQLAVVLAGIGPVLLCVMFCILQFLPQYQRSRATAWEKWLSAQFGLDVHVVSVETPTPDSYVFRSLRLAHPETRSNIGHISMAKVQFERGQWSVQLTAPELESRQLPTAWRLVHDWLLCRHDEKWSPVHLASDALTVKAYEGDILLKDLSVKFLPGADSLLLGSTFQLVDSATNSSIESIIKARNEAPTPTKLIVKRHHDQTRLMTEMQLDTATPLPCSLVRGLVPGIERLGALAKFIGVANIHLRESTWEATIANGQFRNIDMGQFTMGTSAAVSGLGMVTLDRAVLSSKRLEFAEGTFIVGSGAIDASFLTKLCQHAEFACRPFNAVQQLSFDQLGLSFRIQPNQFQAIGILGNSNSLLHDAHGAIAQRSDPSPLPVSRLVDVLAASSTDGDSRWEMPMLAKQAMMWLPSDVNAVRTALGGLSNTR